MNKRRIAAIAAAALMALNVGFQGVSSGLSPLRMNAVEASATINMPQKIEAFVTRMYNVVLGRNPDATGLKNWTTKLTEHTATASDIIYGFFCSDEYKGKKKSNEEIVTDCYNAMLDRDPDAAGKENWVKRLDIGMTTMAVCKGFVGSSEFKDLCASYYIDRGNITLNYARDENYERTYFVYRLYANCLGRTPDITGLENWCKNLKNGTTGTQIAKGFIFSDEYKGKNVSNEEFVTMLYNTILGRTPDSSGLSSWTNQLNIGKSREYVTNGFLFSSEFKGQCSTAGITLGDKLHTIEDDDPYMAYACEVVALVNEQRKANGLPELKVTSDLQSAAKKRAVELYSSFSHTRPNGTSCFTVLNEYGILYSAAGENIAAYYTSPSAVMNGWMNSAGHRENILTEGYEYIGVGVYKSGGSYFWVQIFTAPRD